MKWINKGSKPVDVIFNGRKIRVGVNKIIEGPESFKVYTDLHPLTEKEAKKQKMHTNFKLDKPKIFNARKKHVRPMKKRATIPNEEFPGMINIPSNAVLVDDPSNNHSQVDRARKFIKDYKTDGLPTVGIAILSKDSYDLIRDCVETICKEVKYPKTKIYVLDTGTKDKTVLKYYRKLERNCAFPFKVIDVGQYHFSTNYNKGVKDVDADFVLIQNNDTKIVNDYISKLVKVAYMDKVGLSGPRMIYKDGRIQHDGQHLYDGSGTRFVNPGHVNIGMPHTKVATGRYIVDGITAAGVLLRTKWFSQLKGFDTGFKDIYQDVHLCMNNQAHGKISVCDRSALIYHYDNTSRKKLWHDTHKVQDMAKDHNHLFGKIKNGELKIKKRKKYHFSIITLVNNKKQYDLLLDSLRAQDTNYSFEIIPIPNFNNEYKSCAEALNAGIDVAEGQYHIYCHQDIRFESGWLERIGQHIKELDKSETDWGILGMAGAARTKDNPGYGVSYLANKNANDANYYEETKRQYGDRVVVDCLDELCLIANTKNHLRFDEKTFDHYHWYGADICLQAKSKGLVNFAIDAACIHDSDGVSNLMADKNRKVFIEQAAQLLHKWKNTQPYFRTMTSWFECPRGVAGFFLAQPLKERGVDFPPAIQVKTK